MKKNKKQVRKPQLRVLGNVFTQVLGGGGPDADGHYGKVKASDTAFTM